jgi:chromosome segregation ATPase
MESLFVWIVMSAGVAIALLGAVLFTSERELKTRRREVEELLTKLENMQQGNAPVPSNAPLPDNSAALVELRGANQELQNKITGLSDDLESSRRTIEELEMTQRSHAGDQGKTQQLHAVNEQLKMELNEVRVRLHASEAQLQGSAEIQHDSGQQEITQAHAEIAELREKLNDSQAKIGELERARQNQVDIDALEARHREERQSLNTRVAELEREVSTGREKLQEIETLRAHIAESEQSQKSLREEIQRHEQEAARWQARIMEAEANREQLVALQKPYNELLSKHASLAEMHRDLQQDLSALARLMDTPAQAATASPASLSNAFGQGIPNPSAAPESSVRLEQHEQTAIGAQAEPRRARRFGIFPALLLLAATGAFGA